MKEKTLNWLHNGTIGDVWAAIPAIRQHYKMTGEKAIVLLKNGQSTFYYEGAVHPTVDDEGKQVMLNKSMIEMMIPLLKAQECVADAREWKGELIHVDLNRIRETFVNMPNGCISRWYFYVYPDLACDLTETWLTVPDSEIDLAKGKIIISRTERYTNIHISYKFLNDHQQDLLFVGTELEYQIFKYRFDLLDLKRLVVNDFLELAQALKQCRFHISNQTQAFQLSQGLKIPRIVELCKIAPNVIPVGKDAYDFYAQDGLEYYFHKLNGTVDDYFKRYKEAHPVLNTPNVIPALSEIKKPAEAGLNISQSIAQ